jgi:two-component system CheB/CheR fusion protein
MQELDTRSQAKSAEPMQAEPNRQVQPVSTEQPPRLPFVVVGIGASAGGLEACTDFFSTLPAETGMAFVVVQHLPADRQSMMADILARKTPLPVFQVEDQMPVRPNVVYVIRPGRTLTIHNGMLHLGEPLAKPRHTRPVDDFFRSLADEQRERSICIIMSGMGSNGTAGAQAIKVVGGLCIAQDPDTATQPSMPRSLIHAGLADQVLRPADMPEVLLRYAKHPYVRAELRPELEGLRFEQQLAEILNILRARTKHDFTPYKRPTVLRRIQRRMGLNQIHTVEEYAKFIRQNSVEAASLADDLMIHVTGFFRDPEAWDALYQQVIRPLVAEKPVGGDVRCWAAACSSGEEAYSLAMLLAEAAEAAQKPLNIKVFATDTAQRSLMHARSGLYPGGIESEMPPERLERFFVRDDSLYRIHKDLREMVVFAPHNVMQDPPFSRLDIISCRNLLIYIEPAIQKRVLGLLHFGLRRGGTLFLGSSETIIGSEDLFEPIDKKRRIYRRVGGDRHALPFLSPQAIRDREDMARLEPRPRAPVAQLVQQALLHRRTPPAVVINRDLRVIYFHGSTERYLVQPPGEPIRDLLAMTREELRGPVRKAVEEALAQKGFGSARERMMDAEDGSKRIEILVEPLDLRAPGGNLLVSFIEREEAAPRPRSEAGGADESQRQLVEEIERTRDDLQSTIEELQSSNEELRAANEEITSVNEEMQSTNEELETSKEEMQSLNEELSTVNAQLHSKMEELERASNDLSSLLSSTSIAVVFLDTNYRIRRFTPATKHLIDLLPSDVGRPLKDLNRKFSDPNLMDDASSVLDKLAPLEREVVADTGRPYLRRVLPYRTADNRIDGVVITFVDISEAKRAEKELAVAKEQAEEASHAKDRFIAVLSHELRTPLTPMVLTLSALLGRKDLPAEVHDDLETIRRNLELERRLIDDLLDLSRVISGKLRVALAPANVHPVMQQVLHMVSGEIDAKGQKLDYKPLAQRDLVLGDEARLQQVFGNLLRNAVKFTPEKGMISVRSFNENKSIVVEFRDSGAGIAPTVLDRLFVPFEQGDPEAARHSGGLGLGLAISKSIVELHGGRISVQSEGSGKGATFLVQLPLIPPDAPRSTPTDERAAATSASAKGTRVLLIEDNADTCRLMLRLLRKLGYEVRAATTAEDALRLAKQEPFNLVISDIGLPDGDGRDLMRQLNQRYAITGIAVSGFGTEEDVRQSLAAGFSQHITKPLNLVDLHQAIQRLTAAGA